MRFAESKAILIDQREQLLRGPDSSLLGWCSLFLGNTAWSLGDMAGARKYFTEATASAYRCNDKELEAVATFDAGLVKRFLCHWGEANEDFSRAHQLPLSMGHRGPVAHALRS